MVGCGMLGIMFCRVLLSAEQPLQVGCCTTKSVSKEWWNGRGDLLLVPDSVCEQCARAATAVRQGKRTRARLECLRQLAMREKSYVCVLLNAMTQTCLQAEQGAAAQTDVLYSCMCKRWFKSFLCVRYPCHSSGFGSVLDCNCYVTSIT